MLTIVALIGMGLGNVIGAPLVKKYFPDRQASMVTVFALLMQAGATLPAMTAIPVADALGWQASLASWGLLSLVAIIPWAIHLLKPGAASSAATQTAARSAVEPRKLGLAQLVTNPVSLGTALFNACRPPLKSSAIATTPVDEAQKIRCQMGVFSLPPEASMSSTKEPESAEVTKNSITMHMAIMERKPVSGKCSKKPNKAKAESWLTRLAKSTALWCRIKSMAVLPKTVIHAKVKPVGTSITPVINWRMVRPREMRAIKIPTKGDQDIHQPQ